jgi:hypothetical protein
MFHLGVVSRRRYVVLLVVMVRTNFFYWVFYAEQPQMSLFYFLKVALHDDRRIVPATDAAIASSPKDEQEQPKAEQAVAVVSPPIVSPPTLTPDPPSTLCAGRARANATLLMLARNTDLAGAISSVSQMEDKFNKHCNYPWVFLNEEPFTEDFKRYVVCLPDDSCGHHAYANTGRWRVSRTVPCLLGRYQRSTGSSRIGSMRGSRSRDGTRWSRRILSMPGAFRTCIFFVHVAPQLIRLQISQHVQVHIAYPNTVPFELIQTPL